MSFVLRPLAKLLNQAKIWQVSYKDGVTAVSCKGSLSAVCPVTAVDFLPQVVRRRMCLATGHEDGSIQLHALGGDDDDEFQISNLLNFDSRYVSSTCSQLVENEEEP